MGASVEDAHRKTRDRCRHGHHLRCAPGPARRLDGRSCCGRGGGGLAGPVHNPRYGG